MDKKGQVSPVTVTYVCVLLVEQSSDWVSEIGSVIKRGLVSKEEGVFDHTIVIILILHDQTGSRGNV
jgi:hypothetical protein